MIKFYGKVFWGRVCQPPLFCALFCVRKDFSKRFLLIWYLIKSEKIAERCDIVESREEEIDMLTDAITGAIIGVVVVVIFYLFKGRKK